MPDFQLTKINLSAMKAELLARLRDCCRDEAAFEQLQQILRAEVRESFGGLDEQSTPRVLVAERERSMVRVIGALGQLMIRRIQRSHDFDQVLQVTLDEVRYFLGTDRIAVYQFQPDWSGEFVSESVGAGWVSLLQAQAQNPQLRQNMSECTLQQFGVKRQEALDQTDSLIQATPGAMFSQHDLFVATDIYQKGFSPCYIEMLECYQARAYAILPIYMADRLWGLLAAYQNSQPRFWQTAEINLLAEVSNQLGAALQLGASIQAVQFQAERRQLIANIADRIRQPLEIQLILNTTVQESRQLLQADRVAIYHFTPDWNGEFIAESVTAGWVSLVGPDIKKVWEDTYLQETQGGRYQNNETFVVNDIYTVGHADCHIALLEQFQARSYAIVPIFTSKKLWGLLAAYQNDGPRNWTREEVDLLAQLGVHLGIALQQAELFVSLRQEVAERQQAEQLVRQLNQDLQRRNQELEAINKELEAFAYSVSHDLRAPLRSIDGFSQALLEDYSNQIDSTGQDFLRRVRTATQRMGQLIDDLLTLSRVTRSELRQESVDLSALARAIASELQHTSPTRPVDFVIQDGIVVQGDTRLLRVMLVNLLDNAWKFTSKQAQARIEFGARREEGQTIYFVTDNGAGFDMTYAHKLFGAFQRLHSMTDFPGNGVGLATIQRIVHRHGGRVWAEASVDNGAKFYFTLR